MDFMKAIATAASGLHAQAGRMRVISENIANADSTGQTPGAPRRIAARSRPSGPKSTGHWGPTWWRWGGFEPIRRASAKSTNRAIRQPTPTAMSTIPTSIRWWK
jgi:hypothetical protein